MLRILKKYSDCDHIMSTKDISARLQEEYGIDLERRTLYDNLSVLEDFGYKIHHYESGALGYYLEERKFSEEDILAVHASLKNSPDVPAETRVSIVERMMEDYSIHQTERMRDKLQQN